jgi:hypothetical protein
MFLGKDWPLFRKPTFPVVYRARLGRRFEVDGDVKVAVAEMQRYHRDALAAAAIPRAAAQRSDAKVTA